MGLLSEPDIDCLATIETGYLPSIIIMVARMLVPRSQLFSPDVPALALRRMYSNALVTLLRQPQWHSYYGCKNAGSYTNILLIQLYNTSLVLI